MGFFDDITGLVGDVVKIAIAPVEIAASVTRAVTKPIAELAEDAVDGVKDVIEDITE